MECPSRFANAAVLAAFGQPVSYQQGGSDPFTSQEFRTKGPTRNVLLTLCTCGCLCSSRIFWWRRHAGDLLTFAGVTYTVFDLHDDSAVVAGCHCARGRNGFRSRHLQKQLRIDHLNFRQQSMFKIGTVGVESMKNRLAAAQGPDDNVAKPLTKRYAIYKSRLGKGNRRNLMLTGNMLRNFTVRTVSENRAKASNSTRRDRLKAWINQKIEPWVVFSPKNKVAVADSARRVLQEMKPRLLLERVIGGNR